MPTRALHGLKVLHVGHFDPRYSRNRIMAKALSRAGATVVTLTDPRGFARRAPRLVREVRQMSADLVLVGFPGHSDVPLVRLSLDRATPVVFDAFVSLLETAEDRTGPALRATTAARYALEDRIACRFSTTVLLDTDAHCSYFARRVGVPGPKLRRVWVGADDDLVRPTPLPETGFRVFLYASFIPLHGLEHVVRAAHLLERRGDPIPIDVAGDGATAAEIQGLARRLRVTSVSFGGRLPFEEIVRSMARSHACLGIFGTGGKAARVVPNKVFDALAAARPVVTADTPAAREAVSDREHALLCPPGDPGALAAALCELRDDVALRRQLAAQGYERFRQRYCIDAISADLAQIVLEHLDGRTAHDPSRGAAT